MDDRIVAKFATMGDDTYTSASILRSFASCRRRAEIGSEKRKSVYVWRKIREREREIAIVETLTPSVFVLRYLFLNSSRHVADLSPVQPAPFVRVS